MNDKIRQEILEKEQTLEKLENTILKLKEVLRSGGLGINELDNIGVSIFSLREKTIDIIFNLVILRNK